MSERAQIVAWLRGADESLPDLDRDSASAARQAVYCMDLADAIECGAHLSASPPSKPAPADGWQPIETCKLWQVAIVTDGENVAMAQKAGADYGGHYWAVDPEDGLEWEPTHWIAAPALSNSGQMEKDA